MEILHTLGIDWQLLLAQIVNFGIVLVVLTKFVYKPLLKAIDARRDAIKKSIEEAEEIGRQKLQMEQTRKEALAKADEDAGIIVEKAKTEAETLRASILASAQAQADQILEKGKKQLQDERSHVFHDVQEVMAGSIIKLTEEIIRREFTKEDQSRLLKNLEKELPALLSA